MTDPTAGNIRLELINKDDSAVISDAKIALSLADAKTMTGQTDEMLLRFYTCYLIAKKWGSIMDTRKVDGVDFARPNASGFKKLYDDRLKDILLEAGTSGGLSKVSTNPEFSYDQTKNSMRPRRGGDNYY